MFSDIQITLLRIPVILFAITIHEVAHGYIALLRGDPTARDQGRLTLNPLAHLDIFGAVMMLFGPFGWAKPVPVNPYYFKKRRLDIILVSVAGPVSNIICACAFGLILRFGIGLWPTLFLNQYLQICLQLGFMLNLGLAFFNLIPLPPLDGSKILMGLLPPSSVNTYLKITRHVPMIFLVLLLAEWGLHIRIFSLIFDPLFNPFLDFWKYIVFETGVPQ